MNPRATIGTYRNKKSTFGVVEMVHQSFMAPSPLFSSAAGAGFHHQTTSVMPNGRPVGRPYPRRWPRRVRSHESLIHARTAGEEGEKATKG